MSRQIVAIPDDLLILPLLTRDEETLPVAKLDAEVRAKLQQEIDIALLRLKNPTEFEIAETILQEIVRLFSRLSLIGSNLHELDRLLETLSILEVLQFETRSLIDFIQSSAMRAEGLSEKLHEVLDGISYSISHDIRRIFERELVGSLREQSTPIVYGKILHAHGLLNNCFQQAAITLLQVLNPGLDPLSIFNDSEERLRQSLLLCRDLSSLMRVIRQAVGEDTPEMLRKVVGSILHFRDGSMQYLMYRDWRGYERLALEVITAIENNCDSQALLHKLLCYLEVLYGHVKMRAVLSNMFPSSDETGEE
jgi:hypothetical protein